MNVLYNINGYATHQPVLIELIKKTTGNIIECGCGEGSTKLIVNLIKGTNRKLISLESNKKWYNKYKNIECENHKLLFVDAGEKNIKSTGVYWVEFIKNNKIIQNLDFEICLIDQSPWIARTHCLKYFKTKIKYIIVHDVDYFPKFKKWGKIISVKKNRKKIKYKMDFSDIVNSFIVFYPPFSYFFGTTGPPTLLCSDLENVYNLNINIKKYYT